MAQSPLSIFEVLEDKNRAFGGATDQNRAFEWATERPQVDLGGSEEGSYLRLKDLCITQL